jgi:hypothetical protein
MINKSNKYKRRTLQIIVSQFGYSKPH